MEKNSTPRGRGRPLSFDRQQALDQAVLVFWSKGYDCASLDDLVDAMGITRPSIYAAFGNKHKLFLEAIDRYAETNGQMQMAPLIRENDLRVAIRGYFLKTVESVTRPEMPSGCLIADVATEIAERDFEVRDKLATLFADGEALISRRLQAAKSTGELSPTVDVAQMASMTILIAQGLASHARRGVDRDALTRLADSFVDNLFPH